VPMRRRPLRPSARTAARSPDCDRSHSPAWPIRWRTPPTPEARWRHRKTPTRPGEMAAGLSQPHSRGPAKRGLRPPPRRLAVSFEAAYHRPCSRDVLCAATPPQHALDGGSESLAAARSAIRPALPLLLQPSRFDALGVRAQARRLALLADAEGSGDEVAAGAGFGGAARRDRGCFGTR